MALGEARTTDFMLGTATVMFGPQAEVFDLVPETHGVGLTKNVSIMSEPQFNDLTQGVRNNLVYSVMTGNTVRASFECYEYTAQNLLYAQGLDGSKHVKPTGVSTLASPIAADDDSLEVDAGSGNDFNVGDWLVVEDSIRDKVYARKITAVSTDTLTVDKPFTVAVPAGAGVRAQSLIQIGNKQSQPFLGCKIVGQLADDSTVSMILPKVRVTAGFNLNFASDDFQNMPFELSIYDLVAADPHYDQFRDGPGMALV